MHIDRSSVRCTNIITPVRKTYPLMADFVRCKVDCRPSGLETGIDPLLPKNKPSFDLAPEHEIYRTIRDVDRPSWKTWKTRTANISAAVRQFIDGSVRRAPRFVRIVP
jgi:hypothetical protein